jgi:hypothetical protein
VSLFAERERERERERCSCCPKERRDRLKKLPILIVGYIYVCVIIGLTCIDYRCNCCPKERKEWLKIAMVEPREAAGPSIKIMCNTFQLASHIIYLVLVIYFQDAVVEPREAAGANILDNIICNTLIIGRIYKVFITGDIFIMDLYEIQVPLHTSTPGNICCTCHGRATASCWCAHT